MLIRSRESEEPSPTAPEWGHAVRLKQPKAPETEAPTRSFSFIDVLERKVAEESTLELSTNEKGEKKWEWNPRNLQAEDLMIETFVQRIPMLEETLKDFKEILASAETDHSNHLEVEALLQGNRLKIIEQYIERLKDLAQHNTGKKRADRIPNIGMLDTIQELEQSFMLILEFAKYTAVSLKAQGATSSEQQDDSPLLHLSECLLEQLPNAFGITSTPSGRLHMETTLEWQKLLQPSDVKKLIWTLKHGILPAFEKGLQSFYETLKKDQPGPEGVHHRVPKKVWNAIGFAMQALDDLKQKVTIFTKRIEEDENDDTGMEKHFQLALRDREEIQSLIEKGGHSADGLIMHYQTREIIDEQLQYKDPIASVMHRELLADLDRFLEFTSLINTPYQGPEEGQPIEIPAYTVFTPWLADTLCAQDLTKLPTFP